MLKRSLFLMFSIAIFSQIFASVGSVTLLRGEADIKRDSKVLNAYTNISLEKKDNIKTKEDTKIQLTFKDETVITLGSLTSFKVNEYLEDSKNSQADFMVRKGAFKVITGKIGKLAPKRFKFRTLNAHIGIRGTIFTGEVNVGNKDYIACIEGEIIVTSPKTNEDVHLYSGQMVVIEENGNIAKSSSIDSEDFSFLASAKKVINDASLASVSESIKKRADWEDDLKYDEEYNKPEQVAIKPKQESDKKLKPTIKPKQKPEPKLKPKPTPIPTIKLQPKPKLKPNPIITINPTSSVDMDNLIKSNTKLNFSGKAVGENAFSRKVNGNVYKQINSIEGKAGLAVDFGTNANAVLDVTILKDEMSSFTKNGLIAKHGIDGVGWKSGQIGKSSIEPEFNIQSVNLLDASFVATKSIKKLDDDYNAQLKGKFYEEGAKQFKGVMNSQRIKLDEITKTDMNLDLSRN